MRHHPQAQRGVISVAADGHERGVQPRRHDRRHRRAGTGRRRSGTRRPARQLGSASGASSRGQGVAFSPDGKAVVDRQPRTRRSRLWDAATGPSPRPTHAASRRGHQPWRSAPTASAVADRQPGPDGRGCGTPPRASASANPCEHQGARQGGGVQPRRQDRPDRQLGRDGAGSGTPPPGKPIGQPHAASQAGSTAVAFSPDGKAVLTGSEDKTARLWDAATGQPIGRPMRHQGGVLAVAFSPDGKTVLTGSEDQTARLWDAATGQPIGPPLQASRRGHGRGVQPRRQAVLTGERGQDGAALGRRHRASPSANRCTHQGEVAAVAFSPDGKTVLTGSEDRRRRLWDAATGPAHRPTHGASRRGRRPWRSAPTARPS